jgi:hypothetical protein
MTGAMVNIGACAVPCADSRIAHVVATLSGARLDRKPAITATTVLWVAEVLNRDVAAQRDREAQAAHDGRIPDGARALVADADRAAEDCRQRRLMMEATP